MFMKKLIFSSLLSESDFAKSYNLVIVNQSINFLLNENSGFSCLYHRDFL